MLKITGLRASDYDMTKNGGRKGTNYYVTARTSEGVGEFNAIVYKLNENALNDTIYFNKLKDSDDLLGKYVDDGETKSKTNKYGQIMYLKVYNTEK